jgi:hypothetical protein
VKYAEEIMEILEGFDLTGSLRDATETGRVLPNTVARLCGRSGGWDIGARSGGASTEQDR